MMPKQNDRLLDLRSKTDQPWTDDDIAVVLEAFREADPATRQDVLDFLRATAERKETPQ
jgi:hypothetical protein